MLGEPGGFESSHGTRSMYVVLFLVAGSVLVESVRPVKVVSAYLLGRKILGVFQQSL